MIRRANLDDVLQVAQVHVQSWHETYQNIVRPEILDQINIDQKIQIWEMVMNDPNQVVFVYEEQRDVLGFADFYFKPHSEIGELKAIYLLNKIQARGIGAEFLKRGFDLFKAKNYKQIIVEVFDQNNSRYFYEKSGAYFVSEKSANEYAEGLKILHYRWDI